MGLFADELKRLTLKRAFEERVHLNESTFIFWGGLDVGGAS